MARIFQRLPIEFGRVAAEWAAPRPSEEMLIPQKTLTGQVSFLRGLGWKADLPHFRYRKALVAP